MPQKLIRELILGIDHVGLAVQNLESSIEYWVENFGAKIHSREINQEQQVEEALLEFPNKTQIQLLCATNSDSTIAKFIEKNGPGVQQVALHVSDLAAATKILASKNIPMVFPVPKSGSNNSSINFIHPKYAGGVLLELVEYPA